eukprot:TRINITY_DN2772_c0_g1_i4.p1 TRINITY_DN2772_c0_g1~~TRINITY_DN2772_c0_g1_i4.p1  ORF type:complete len:2149 (+),score=568.77 TRINITY_DN2772_c0_g1_i4:102-6548(+)
MSAALGAVLCAAVGGALPAESAGAVAAASAAVRVAASRRRTVHKRAAAAAAHPPDADPLPCSGPPTKVLKVKYGECTFADDAYVIVDPCAGSSSLQFKAFTSQDCSGAAAATGTLPVNVCEKDADEHTVYTCAADHAEVQVWEAAALARAEVGVCAAAAVSNTSVGSGAGCRPTGDGGYERLTCRSSFADSDACKRKMLQLADAITKCQDCDSDDLECTSAKQYGVACRQRPTCFADFRAAYDQPGMAQCIEASHRVKAEYVLWGFQGGLLDGGCPGVPSDFEGAHASCEGKLFLFGRESKRCKDCDGDGDGKLRRCRAGESEFGVKCKSQDDCFSTMAGMLEHGVAECAGVAGNSKAFALAALRSQFETAGCSTESDVGAGCYGHLTALLDAQKKCRDCSTDEPEAGLPKCADGQREYGVKCQSQPDCYGMFAKAVEGPEAASCFRNIFNATAGDNLPQLFLQGIVVTLAGGDCPLPPDVAEDPSTSCALSLSQLLRADETCKEADDTFGAKCRANPACYGLYEAALKDAACLRSAFGVDPGFILNATAHSMAEAGCTAPNVTLAGAGDFFSSSAWLSILEAMLNGTGSLFPPPTSHYPTAYNPGGTSYPSYNCDSVFGELQQLDKVCKDCSQGDNGFGGERCNGRPEWGVKCSARPSCFGEFAAVFERPGTSHCLASAGFPADHDYAERLAAAFVAAGCPVDEPYRSSPCVGAIVRLQELDGRCRDCHRDDGSPRCAADQPEFGAKCASDPSCAAGYWALSRDPAVHGCGIGVDGAGAERYLSAALATCPKPGGTAFPTYSGAGSHHPTSVGGTYYPSRDHGSHFPTAGGSSYPTAHSDTHFPAAHGSSYPTAHSDTHFPAAHGGNPTAHPAAHGSSYPTAHSDTRFPAVHGSSFPTAPGATRPPTESTADTAFPSTPADHRRPQPQQSPPTRFPTSFPAAGGGISSEFPTSGRFTHFPAAGRAPSEYPTPGGVRSHSEFPTSAGTRYPTSEGGSCEALLSEVHQVDLRCKDCDKEAASAGLPKCNGQHEWGLKCAAHPTCFSEYAAIVGRPGARGCLARVGIPQHVDLLQKLAVALMVRNCEADEPYRSSPCVDLFTTLEELDVRCRDCSDDGCSAGQPEFGEKCRTDAACVTDYLTLLRQPDMAACLPLLDTNTADAERYFSAALAGCAQPAGTSFPTTSRGTYPPAAGPRVSAKCAPLLAPFEEIDRDCKDCDDGEHQSVPRCNGRPEFGQKCRDRPLCFFRYSQQITAAQDCLHEVTSVSKTELLSSLARTMAIEGCEVDPKYVSETCVSFYKRLRVFQGNCQDCSMAPSSANRVCASGEPEYGGKCRLRADCATEGMQAVQDPDSCWSIAGLTETAATSYLSVALAACSGPAGGGTVLRQVWAGKSGCSGDSCCSGEPDVVQEADSGSCVARGGGSARMQCQADGTVSVATYPTHDDGADRKCSLAGCCGVPPIPSTTGCAGCPPGAAFSKATRVCTYCTPDAERVSGARLGPGQVMCPFLAPVVASARPAVLAMLEGSWFNLARQQLFEVSGGLWTLTTAEAGSSPRRDHGSFEVLETTATHGGFIVGVTNSNGGSSGSRYELLRLAEGQYGRELHLMNRGQDLHKGSLAEQLRTLVPFRRMLAPRGSVSLPKIGQKFGITAAQWAVIKTYSDQFCQDAVTEVRYVPLGQCVWTATGSLKVTGLNAQRWAEAGCVGDPATTAALRPHECAGGVKLVASGLINVSAAETLELEFPGSSVNGKCPSVAPAIKDASFECTPHALKRTMCAAPGVRVVWQGGTGSCEDIRSSSASFRIEAIQGTCGGECSDHGSESFSWIGCGRASAECSLGAPAVRLVTVVSGVTKDALKNDEVRAGILAAMVSALRKSRGPTAGEDPLTRSRLKLVSAEEYRSGRWVAVDLTSRHASASQTEGQLRLTVEVEAGLEDDAAALQTGAESADFGSNLADALKDEMEAVDPLYDTAAIHVGTAAATAPPTTTAGVPGTRPPTAAGGGLAGCGDVLPLNAVGCAGCPPATFYSVSTRACHSCLFDKKTRATKQNVAAAGAAVEWCGPDSSPSSSDDKPTVLIMVAGGAAAAVLASAFAAFFYVRSKRRMQRLPHRGPSPDAELSSVHGHAQAPAALPTLPATSPDTNSPRPTKNDA